jgi:hypothetical protein
MGKVITGEVVPSNPSSGIEFSGNAVFTGITSNIINSNDIKIHDTSYSRLEWYNDSDTIDSNDYWIAEHHNDGGIKIMRRDNSASSWGNNLILKADGNVGIGTQSISEKLTVAGNITASGDVISTSDVRVKTDIKPITGALDIVNKLEGKRFNKFNKPGIGFIAQELEQYMPELVHTANDEAGTKSVNYANMVALLVEAIKEQQVTINKLESKLNGN